MRGKRRWVAIAVVVIVVGGGGTGAWALTQSGSSATSATTTLVAATTGDIQNSVSTTGTIEPAQDDVLTFSVSGTITSVPAAVGTRVTKGQVLATVDSTTLHTSVTTATAAVAAAEAQTTSVAAATATQQAAAAAQLAAANTGLATAQDNLAAASLTAPFSGVVASVGYTVGDSVGSGSGAVGTGKSAASTSTISGITVITTDSWVVNATVGSSDLAKLTKGLQATITPSGATQNVFGTIASLGIVATASTGGSATFPVVIDVTGSPTGLFAGASADVTLLISQLSNVLTVPTLALHTVNGKTVVYQHVGGKRVTTTVVVGTAYGATTQILSGLTTGDEVEITFPGGGIGRRSGTTNRRSGTTTGTTGGGFGGGSFGGGGAATGGFGGGP